MKSDFIGYGACGRGRQNETKLTFSHPPRNSSNVQLACVIYKVQSMILGMRVIQSRRREVSQSWRRRLCADEIPGRAGYSAMSWMRGDVFRLVQGRLKRASLEVFWLSALRAIVVVRSASCVVSVAANKNRQSVEAPRYIGGDKRSCCSARAHIHTAAHDAFHIGDAELWIRPRQQLTTPI